MPIPRRNTRPVHARTPPPQRRPLEETDLERLAVPLDPQLSPDGRRVVFVLRSFDPLLGKDVSHLWITSDEEQPRPFTTGPLRDWAPRWSPDGRQIAFLTERPARGSPAPSSRPRHQIAVIPADGGEARVVTDLDGTLGPVTWEPSGRRLAFAMRPHEPRDKGQEERLAIHVSHIEYKLNGPGYRSQEHSHVHVLDLDDPDHPHPLTEGDFDDHAPAWSPDGRLIAFLSQRRADRARDLENLDLWVVPAQGGRPRQLTRLRGAAWAPAWSPDGRGLAFVECPGPLGNGEKDNAHVFFVEADGSGPEIDLTPDLDRTTLNLTLNDTVGLDHMAIAPVFADGGHQLCFPVTDRGRTRILAVGRGADGRWSSPRPVLEEGTAAAFSGTPRATRLAVVWTDSTTPPQVELVDLAGGQRRVVASPNASWIPQVDILAPEEIEVPSGDGATVHGWLLRPRRRGLAPLVLQIHGGPHAQYGDAFFFELQLLAARGFAVLYTNPRGSQGYGRAFTWAIHPDWGTLPQRDVLAAVEHATRSRGIDPRRVGVAGGSYGGYLTLWLAGHTDRFRAACAQRVVSDMASMLWSDMGGQVGPMLGAWPWEDPDLYRRLSPITYADRVRTPLLILQGLADQRTPADQGERMYVTLKALGKDVRMVLFPGADHDLSRKGPTPQRRARLRAILDWFEERLAGR